MEVMLAIIEIVTRGTAMFFLARFMLELSLQIMVVGCCADRGGAQPLSWLGVCSVC